MTFWVLDGWETGWEAARRVEADDEHEAAFKAGLALQADSDRPIEVLFLAQTPSGRGAKAYRLFLEVTVAPSYETPPPPKEGG